MRILIAPDSFKESLRAEEVARALRDGIASVLPTATFDLVPLADGGEGTVDALVDATGGHTVAAEVTGPLGELLTARYGMLGDGRSAVVEMAAASGLMLVPAAQRDPSQTTSFGTGELIRHALTQDIETLIVAIGGSATVDGGAGLLQALGVKFFDADGHQITRPLCGGQLHKIARIDPTGLAPRLLAVSLKVACDVDNPLLGPQGAAAVFGPQKGATLAQIAELEAGLSHFYQLLEMRLGVSVIARPGAGAAGGVGAALLAFSSASLVPGIELVSAATRLAERIAAADLVITGEGQLDAQTLFGKAPAGVAALARASGVPVIAVGGSLAGDAQTALAEAFDALEACVTRPLALADALQEARSAATQTGARIGHWLALGARLYQNSN